MKLYYCDNLCSLNRLERRTFSFTIIFETKASSKLKPQRNYRNPILMANEYKRMINSGQARNEADLARQLGVSRVTVNHYITLLKLAPEVIQTIEKIGYPMTKRYVSVRKLRSILKMPSEKQKAIIEALTSQCHSKT